MTHGTCGAPDCERPVRTKGLCNMHYQRWLAHGELSAHPNGPPAYTREEYERTFWARYVKVSSGCWEWQGSCNERGYGKVKAFGRRTQALAHLVAYELAVGPVPKGLFVCHRCDNPPCGNPADLFLGTHLDNVVDAYSKGRGRGRLLDEAQMYEVLDRREAGEAVRVLALEFGVSEATISNIIHGKTRRQREVLDERRP